MNSTANNLNCPPRLRDFLRICYMCFQDHGISGVGKTETHFIFWNTKKKKKRKAFITLTIINNYDDLLTSHLCFTDTHRNYNCTCHNLIPGFGNPASRLNQQMQSSILPTFFPLKVS